MRDVSVASLALFCPAGIGAEGATGGRKGEVPGFSAKAYVRQRKNLKLMSRAVQLGVSAIRVALSEAEGWESIPPLRRGMYVGSTPQGGELADLIAALEVSTDAEGAFDIGRFAQEGYPLIHPLWLVKGLSNNVLGFASASHDFQGPNGNWCDGEQSGANALYEGYVAVAEGRADVVVAGASDSWVELEGVLGGRRPGEGAAFFVLRPATPGDPWRVQPGAGEDPDLEEAQLGYLGAAGVPVALARRLLRGEPAAFRGPGRTTLRFHAA
ncbi:MAG: hypothetical protein H6740_24225 [Alphaproteobacteria bacterium]|nr:hypothetical protein [Alphaproteobacteria bacterium]